MLGIFLSNCEDGEIGPAGKDGIDGTDGTDGTNGTDGENGVGFEELTKYGSIKLTLTGKRPDGVAINATETFKFTNPSGVQNRFYKTDEYLSFEPQRFLNTTNDNFREMEPQINFYLELTDPGKETEAFSYFEVSLQNYIAIANDQTYFNMNAFMATSLPHDAENSGINNFSFTNYNFNEETNKLSFTSSFVLPAEAKGNQTKHDLSIEIEVDITVLKSIDPIHLKKH